MKIWHKVILLIIIFVIFSYLFAKPPIPQKPKSSLPQKTITNSVLPAATSAAGLLDQAGICQIQGVLPDSSCTPGAIDPQVTQDNIDQTICKTGYTKTVRPPVSYTNKLKRQQIADYGYSDKNLQDYEEDHLISLELGGNPTDPKNLWPEPGASPNPKDKIENLCNKKVCSRQITLEQAQREIATNWTTACQ
jgi:hypothetical protein